jgi:hypothetical protein
MPLITQEATSIYQRLDVGSFAPLLLEFNFLCFDRTIAFVTGITNSMAESTFL